MCFYASAHMPAHTYVEARGIFGVLFFQLPFLFCLSLFSFPFFSFSFSFLPSFLFLFPSLTLLSLLFLSSPLPSPPFPSSFPFLLFSVNLELADLTRLADQHFPGIFCFLPFQH